MRYTIHKTRWRKGLKRFPPYLVQLCDGRWPRWGRGSWRWGKVTCKKCLRLRP